MRIRNATFADWERIDFIGRQTFASRANVLPSAAERRADEAHFRSRWENHPQRARFTNVPIGWMLETDQGECVGTYSNHWGCYWYRGEVLRAAISSAWAVLPEHRGPPALMLVSAYLRQRGVDLLINTSANEAASKIWEAMKARRVPVPNLDRCFFWTLRHGPFLRAAATKKGWSLPAPFCAVAGFPLDGFMKLGRAVMGGSRGFCIQPAAGFDRRFDVFWEELKGAYPQRLLAYRDAATLTWHFGHRLEAGTAKIVTLVAGEKIRGYAVVLIAETPSLGLCRARLADLQVVDTGPAGLAALVSASWRIAEAKGAAMFEIFGLTEEKRKVLAGLLPLRRRIPSWPYLYKVPSAALAAELARPEVWDISDYDGDNTL